MTTRWASENSRDTAIDKGKQGHEAGAEPKRSKDSSMNTHTQEDDMKRGHVTGHKKERKGASDWYKQIEAGNLARIEKEWQEKQKQGK